MIGYITYNGHLTEIDSIELRDQKIKIKAAIEATGYDYDISKVVLIELLDDQHQPVYMTTCELADKVHIQGRDTFCITITLPIIDEPRR